MFNGVGLVGFKSMINASSLAYAVLSPFDLQPFSFSYTFFNDVTLWGWGLRADTVHPLSPSLAMPTFIMIITTIIINILIIISHSGCTAGD